MDEPHYESYLRLDRSSSPPLPSHAGLGVRSSSTEAEGSVNMQSPSGSRISHEDWVKEMDRDEVHASFLMAEEEDLSYSVADLDTFLCKVYDYYVSHGFWCSVIDGLASLLIFLFVIALVVFLSLFIDYDSLLEVSSNTNTSFWDDIVMVPDSVHPAVIAIYSCFGLLWIWRAVQFARDLPGLIEVKSFFNNYLQISDDELQRMEWHRVVSRILKVNRLCVANPNWTALDVVNRIMRKQNYFISLVNKDVLNLEVPLLGPLSRALVGSESGLTAFTSKSLEWSINFILNRSMFDEKHCVKPEVLAAASNSAELDKLEAMLTKRFRLVGLISFIIFPFVLFYLLSYQIVKYGEMMRSRPSDMGTRSWSLLARWKFRELNELSHLFDARMARASTPAQKYMKQFKAYTVSAVANFFSFVFGGLLVMMLFLGLFSDKIFTEVTFADDKSGIWVMSLLGASLAVCRAFVCDDCLEFDPEGAMAEVNRHTHFMPLHWRGRAHAKRTRQEFATLFPNRLILMVDELLGVIFSPLILMFSLPSSSRRIALFYAKHTSYIDGFGHACTFAFFPLSTHGNPDYGAPRQGRQVTTGPMSGRGGELDTTADGKMEKSFIGFVSSYPDWESPDEGKGNSTFSLIPGGRCWAR